ncbi:amino acid ABC transporter permease [Aureimonas populi]|uniref:Amino acid ABC transporter permease n=1 Tax=Aureimonas populi TaxID=1701758 RepID=A0ABW5CPH3_9HYPH|nr:amino acid ABC transporter permease [Aureimonas populi]
MSLDPFVVLDHWDLFARGALMSLRICATAFVFGLLIGAVAAAFSFTSFAPLRWLVFVYIMLMRGIPFIVILFLVHYGMPAAGIRNSALFNGTVALSLFAGAYYTEIIRACVKALPAGQWESARAIGMSPFAAARHVILPQVRSPMIPPVVNTTMTMIKESSVISSITVAELTFQGLVVQGNTFAPFEVFIAVALIYWFITAVFAAVADAFERRLGSAQRAGRMNPLAARYLILDGRDAR